MLKAAFALLALPALLAGCFTGGAPALAVATGQIDGAVVDHLLHPFGDQEVTLVQLERTDRTSPLGGFTFRAVPPGTYTLTTTLSDGGTATAVVDVQADKVTRVILQVLPQPEALPWFEAHTFRSTGERPSAGQVCASCEWAVPLGADRPSEVTFEAVWAAGPGLGGDALGEHINDHLHIQITDGRGFPLFNDKDVASPAYVSIAGADIHPEATEIRIQVEFGDGFTPSPQEFRMTSVVTNYFGGTKLEQFGIPA